MKSLVFKTCIILNLLTIQIWSQSQFSSDNYIQHIQQNQNLTFDGLQSNFPTDQYFKGFEQNPSPYAYTYYDTIAKEYALTEQEKQLLELNRFVVTERLSFDCFGAAFHDVYAKDLPVFITTDAVLHALHASYDRILKDLEISILKPNLTAFLNSLSTAFPQLIQKYAQLDTMQVFLEDVDLYVTMARSLVDGQQLPPQLIAGTKVDAMWEGIQSNTLTMLPLFSNRSRRLDFSQFTVRGHYNNDALRDYFKAMMWLGRMDFFLTPPPENPWEAPWTREEIQRMNVSAFLLNELIDMSENRALLDQNDHIISFLVGESDNLTPQEFSTVIQKQGIESADNLLGDTVYVTYQAALKVANGAEQKILSQFMLMDPYSTEPGELPISFRLMGQRFIIDSYVFSNLVFDRIIYQNQKVWRPMPDPLDALFVLGNDDALPLLREELETYHYAAQLDALRYLVDAYDSDFWEASLYNVWLDAIRTLNPQLSTEALPVFMKTAAWRQSKINTQLASWSQLRHDNLLYTKQSYTGGTACSFPCSFVEPVPGFYAQVGQFAEKAETYFSQFGDDTYEMYQIKMYFPKLKNIMTKLETLAYKELNSEDFDKDETDWLKEMLFEGAGSGAPPFSGWYSDLYYYPDEAAYSNYCVADVHTQPTEFDGSVVGRVLHAGTGRINLGIYLIENSSSGKPTAYVGPAMSYYETITRNFERLTDEGWTEKVEANQLPARPDWVNIYLANAEGNGFTPGRELPSLIFSSVNDKPGPIPRTFELSQNFPNPFNPTTNIGYSLPESGPVTLIVFNSIGQKIGEWIHENQPAGYHAIQFNGSMLPTGCYYYHIESGNWTAGRKMMLIK